MDPEINSYFLSDIKSLHFYIFLELLLQFWYIILYISVIFSDNHYCWKSTKLYFPLDSFTFCSWKFYFRGIYFTLRNISSYGKYSSFLELLIFQSIFILSTSQLLCLSSLLVILAFLTKLNFTKWTLIFLITWILLHYKSLLYFMVYNLSSKWCNIITNNLLSPSGISILKMILPHKCHITIENMIYNFFKILKSFFLKSDKRQCTARILKVWKVNKMSSMFPQSLRLWKYLHSDWQMRDPNKTE